MRSETPDYIIEERASDLWITFSGPFTREHVPVFREKFVSLIEDGNKFFVIDLEKVTSIDGVVVQLFLQLLNMLKGRSGSLKLVFKNERVTRALTYYKNIFTVFPDATLLEKRGLAAILYRQRRFLLRKTGVRLSRPVALFLIMTLFGWFISMLFIIHLQNRHIKEQQTELQELTHSEMKFRIEIDKLRSRLQPLEQLGILKDTVALP